MKTAISLTNVTKVFKDGPHGKPLSAVRGISFDVGLGEFFVLVGQSGCGKSTLLRMMCGLDAPTNGTITLGKGITHNDMGFVFQQFALLPWLSVFENVELVLFRRDPSASSREARVLRVLKRLGLQKFVDAHPHELSGGLRQRVGIARALVIEPKIIFMDEPFSELDSFTAQDLRQEMLRIWEEQKMTVVMVTHLIPEAIQLADRIIVLTPRPARIEKVVINPLVRPRSPRSPEFFALEDRLAKLVKP